MGESVKHILTVQDISCVGRCSLTVALPIISALGVEASVLPTALLSTHTLFPSPAVCDLTEQLPHIAAHWRALGLTFDGIYTGYLGSLAQLEWVGDFIDEFRGEGFVFVDPVMGDHGRLYSRFTPDFAGRMARLCAKADVIVPNLTEACLLLGRPYIGERYDEAQIRELLRALISLGAKKAIITGVSFSPETLGAVAYDGEKGGYVSSFGARLGDSFHGTGDIFASVCVGMLAGGHSLGEAIETAVAFTCECIRQTIGSPRDKAFGVNFELALPMLMTKKSRGNG